MLDGDQIVGTPAVEVPGLVTLSVQSVRCHHRTADVYAVQQRGEQRDLVGLGAHFYLAQHRAMGMVERREQVRAVQADMPRLRFNPPPIPLSWPLYVEDVPPPGAPWERNSRSIPQDVRIAVSVRDQGRCVCQGCALHRGPCGSTEDLHFDHKIPYSRGGANTVANIQLLCGPLQPP